jgi:putative holliday junction resolvase
VTKRRALGLDLGERRIGVAVSDSARSLALPLCTIERTGNREQEHRRIRDLVDEMGIGVVVIGLPLSLDGTAGRAARSVTEEAEAISAVLGPSGAEVVTHDERLSTVEANQALARAGKSARARRKTVDQTAAAVILEAWLARG